MAELTWSVGAPGLTALERCGLGTASTSHRLTHPSIAIPWCSAGLTTYRPGTR